MSATARISSARHLSRARRREDRRGQQFCLLAMALLAAVACGCASAGAAPAPDAAIRLTVSTDRETYRIGAPVVATVVLENLGDKTLYVPRFDAAGVRFLVAGDPETPPRARRPVESQAVAPIPREVKPGGKTTRRFLFTQLTDEPGPHRLLVQLSGVAQDGALLDGTLISPPAAFTVSEEVALRRDPANGLILKEQAAELAAAHAGGATERIVLVPLGESGLYTWVAWVASESGQGPPVRKAVEVNAYTGRTKDVEMAAADADDRAVKPAASAPNASQALLPTAPVRDAAPVSEKEETTP